MDHQTKPYEKVKSFSAVPRQLVWDEAGKEVLGFSMEKLVGWNALSEILTESNSKDLKIDLRDSGLILTELCKGLKEIHAQGFVVGDLNPSNILFKRKSNEFLVKIIDVDSWSIYRNDDLGIEYSSKVLDKNVIYPPDMITADRTGHPWPNFTPRHDWWSFACVSWMVLTKFDPFMTGMIADVDREDRILGKHTANSAVTVRLRPKCGPIMQALGPKLRLLLDRHLKLKVPRPFPEKVLEEFALGIKKCKKCGFATHASAMACPSCAVILGG
jgi:serine/threonine protein kinase